MFTTVRKIQLTYVTLGATQVPVTSLSNRTTKGQTSGTTHTTQIKHSTRTQTSSLKTTTQPKSILSTTSSSTTADKSKASNPEASKHGTTKIPVTSLSNRTTKGQANRTTHTTQVKHPERTQTSSLTATPTNTILSATSSLTTADNSNASNHKASKHGSTTTVIAAAVSVAVALAVAAVVVLLVLRKKHVLPCSKSTPTSNIGKHTFEKGPEQSYEDLVDRNESNTQYCVLDIDIGSADAASLYCNIQRGQNNESKTNDNCNSEYYNNMVALEHFKNNT